MITFEECNLCKERKLRKEGRYIYNKQRNEFYIVWECYNCDNMIYDTIQFNKLENGYIIKEMCMSLQKYNRNKKQQKN